MMSTLKVSKERLINLLVAPHVSEKSARAAAANQYVFKVLTDATKPEIKAAVEFMAMMMPTTEAEAPTEVAYTGM